MSFNRTSRISGDQSAAAAAGAAGAGASSEGEDSFNVGRVSNTGADPETCFSSLLFRPLSDDGRAKIGPLNAKEKEFIQSAIKFNKRKAAEAFARLNMDKEPNVEDIKMLEMCTRELINFNQINKTYGPKQ